MCHPMQGKGTIESIDNAICFTLHCDFSFFSHFVRSFVLFPFGWCCCCCCCWCFARACVCMCAHLLSTPCSLGLSLARPDTTKPDTNDYKTATMIIANNTFRVSTHTRTPYHTLTHTSTLASSHAWMKHAHTYTFATIYRSVTLLPTHYLG